MPPDMACRVEPCLVRGRRRLLQPPGRAPAKLHALCAQRAQDGAPLDLIQIGIHGTPDMLRVRGQFDECGSPAVRLSHQNEAFGLQGMKNTQRHALVEALTTGVQPLFGQCAVREAVAGLREVVRVSKQEIHLRQHVNPQMGQCGAGGRYERQPLGREHTARRMQERGPAGPHHGGGIRHGERAAAQARRRACVDSVRRERGNRGHRRIGRRHRSGSRGARRRNPINVANQGNKYYFRAFMRKSVGKLLS
jgi:hypothetical protein